MQEKVIEIKQCKHCNTKFEITDKDLEFYEKVSLVFQTPPNLPLSGEGQKAMGNGKVKYLIPTPTLCPDCRQQRRLSFRNERHLYKRNCDATGKQIISIYSPDKPYKVYNSDFWWSDKWDPMDYGKEFDFSRGFFEQFDELVRDVPKPSLSGIGNENCEYTNLLGYSKDCYLSISGDYNDTCFYCNSLDRSTNCFDCGILESSNSCYECIDIYTCTKCFYGIDLKNCDNCTFCKNCTGCSFCFGCYELLNKSYYIYNKPVSKEEYHNFLENNKLSFDIFNNLKNNTPTSCVKNLNCENVVGDNLNNSKNCYYCFNLKGSEDVKYSERGYDGKQSMDVYGLFDINICYDSNSVGVKSFNILFSDTCWDNLSNLFYCNHCFNGCDNLFGCVGLKNKSYCIFNKQYTKEEYEKLVPKIIELMQIPHPNPLLGEEREQATIEWGEFFPSSISPFGYNETVAMEYFPIPHPNPLLGEEREQTTENVLHPSPSKEKELRMRFNQSTYEQPLPNVEKIIPASKLPENITDIPDDILNWAIECEITKKPFRIIKLELEFYRKHNLPIPKRHPDQRHLDRMKLRNPRKLFDRKCDKCGADMKTTHEPDKKELVYCEKCYEKEVY